jgi:hypothetical protein
MIATARRDAARISAPSNTTECLGFSERDRDRIIDANDAGNG